MSDGPPEGSEAFPLEALKARAPNGKSYGTGRWRHRAYEGPEVSWHDVGFIGGPESGCSAAESKRNICAMAPRPEAVEESRVERGC